LLVIVGLATGVSNIPTTNTSPTSPYQDNYNSDSSYDYDRYDYDYNY
jgi:hypothetical protein